MKQQNNMNEPSFEEKVKESIIIRGIATSLQNMAMPTFDNLSKMVIKFGYQLTKIDSNLYNG